MQLARKEPLRALPVAEKWIAEGGGMGARHCVAVAMFQAGKLPPGGGAVRGDRPRHGPGPAGPARRAVGPGRPGLDRGGRRRQGGRGAEPALELKTNDADLWIDRGLSLRRHAGLAARHLRLRPGASACGQDDVEILVLRAAAWRNARDPGQALADVERALRIAPDHSEALLERGFANLARGDRTRPTTTSTGC